MLPTAVTAAYVCRENLLLAGNRRLRGACNGRFPAHVRNEPDKGGRSKLLREHQIAFVLLRIHFERWLKLYM